MSAFFSRFSLLGLGALSALQAAGQAQRPNILFILCDDLGYADLGCYGQKRIATPHLDKMAAEGMRFTQAYAGSPVSAPSRATVMTGQHTGHTHVRGNKEYWHHRDVANMYGKNTDHQEGWAGQEPYDTLHPILPEILKKAGYTTGMFGKWAGGYESSASTPDKRGIDEYYGYLCQFNAHAYYPNYLNAFSRSAGDTSTHRVVLHENIKYGMPGSADYTQRPQYAADLIHQKALEWLDQQNKDQAFLGIFTYVLPHAELVQPQDSLLKAYAGRFAQENTYPGNTPSRYHSTQQGHAEFAAMVTRLDQQVGEIMEKLREKGLDENTLVIFTSDNGPHTEGGANPAFFDQTALLRGTKRSIHEGGIRIPFIARWKGKIAAGEANDHQLAFYDLLPTFAEVAGLKDFPQAYQKNDQNSFDGISFLPTLLGKNEMQQKHRFLYWEFHETDMMGLRMDNWKLVVERGRPKLYNLNEDLHEDHDLSAQHPDIVREMVKILLQEHRPSDLFPVTLPQ